MQPRIQYAKTADGVSIAFWIQGQGDPPLVLVPSLTSPSALEALPRMRSVLERLGADRMLVRYDMRGSGMSDRGTPDFSLDARMHDIEAVVDRLELGRFALYAAAFGGGPVAIAYAAHHPERVSHLILMDSYASGPRLLEEIPWAKAIVQLIETDWTLYTETAAHSLLGWSEGEMAHEVAAATRQSASHEAAKALIRAQMTDDVRHLLPLVRSPALVLHRRGSAVPVNVTQELATGIPNARLMVLEGPSPPPVDVAHARAAVINEFLAAGEPGDITAQPPVPDAFRTVLFTDLVGHTEMMLRLGDERCREVLREHERITRGVLKAHGGAEVKTMGDGFMASFGSVTRPWSAPLLCNGKSEIANRKSESGLRCGAG